MYRAHIIERAVSQAALDVAIAIPQRAASLLGTEHLAVLISRALSLSAHHLPVLMT
jgi:hypothetical protein